MNLIVNVDLDWGIGRQGELLVRLKQDMLHFKQLTVGQVVVFGRKTLATFPQGQPLPQRTNIILTRDRSIQRNDAIICCNLAELAEQLTAYPSDAVFIIGGDRVYRQLLPFCSCAYVTRVHRRLQADAFFPNLDRQPTWKLEDTGPIQTGVSRLGDPDDLLDYQFCLYRQAQPADLIQWIRERGDPLDAVD